MSHFVLVCERGKRVDRARLATFLEDSARLLLPRGITAGATRLVIEDGLTLAVINPNEGVSLHGASLCLGRILDAPGEWWRPGTLPPDGTYAMCRCSADVVEIVTDIPPSRTVWYYHDDDLFLASSSQRPLVALLGSLALDREAVTWMVAGRSLGPRPSYDARLSRSPVDGRVRLDRHTWSLEVASQWQPYRASERSDDEHAKLLSEAIVETCAYLVPDADRWPLLLSGGYDSRALLMGMLQAGAKPRCVTWGLASALRDERSDAFVARRVAEAVNVPHEFFRLDGRRRAAVEGLEEFIVRSEGQVIDFAMYLDGFETWRTLVGQGCAGVVRGDNYAWAYLGEFRTTRSVRHHVSADLLRDYAPSHPIHRLGLAKQTWPARLERQPDEDLLRYRDRLWRMLYIPKRIAPLNQIKAPYVEIVNPLKARRVADVVQSLPERLRLHPGALARVLEREGPAVPFATRPAATLPVVLEIPEVCEAIATRLCSDTAYRLYDRAAVDEVATTLLRPPAPAGRAKAVRGVRARLPRKFKDMALPVVGVRLDAKELALRMLVAARAVELFEDDVKRIGPSPLFETGGAVPARAGGVARSLSSPTSRGEPERATCGGA